MCQKARHTPSQPVLDQGAPSLKQKMFSFGHFTKLLAKGGERGLFHQVIVPRNGICNRLCFLTRMFNDIFVNQQKNYIYLFCVFRMFFFIRYYHLFFSPILFYKLHIFAGQLSSFLKPLIFSRGLSPVQRSLQSTEYFYI